MVSRTLRFNIYLLLAAALITLTGCQTPESKHDKQIASLRVYLEINPGPPGRGQKISVLRAAPIKLEIESAPFLSETHLKSAELRETPGAFSLAITFDLKGKWLLEQYTATNPNKRFAIRSQFGVEPDVKDRWLGAPLVTHQITDGVLVFTPDVSREEAEQIVIGLNNFAGVPPPPKLKEPEAK